ncbi:alpha/beta hydrolase family protein [Streptomyces sp. NBC_00151]|jgi:predicted alpha/beta hydrolase|uniref:alpha/beta hydrolase family protein n=1 Tax=Streptomyces sp. NBC_00151 TaxID=2975669 RepID=UPI002DDC0E69|nr:alpha/beta fold hydrolase [Streptomyces sp. NBC_00151]WRZ36832.1 alpha/beta fold hydrolase [Streptomyces sp. NBC_00151]WRZ44745.1 alpha/beta fold hydrolase [Streptomyces sp. NBC_00151]
MDGQGKRDAGAEVWQILAAGAEGPPRSPLSARVTSPVGPPRAVIVIWPALGVDAAYYDPFCERLAALGIAAVAVDLRGQGASRPRPGRSTRHGYHELASRDWPTVLDAVRERFGLGVPLYPLGHSIGGQVGVLYLAREPESVDGLLLVAAGSVDFRGFRGAARYRVLASTQLVALIATLWGFWPGHRLGFGGRQPARLMRDWARICRTGRFVPAGADIDYEARLGAVTLPVLAVSVAGDHLAPAGAVDRLCAKLPAAEVQRWHYRPDGGERIDHVRWARRGAGVAERISGWLAEREATVQRPS